ncbi:MAG: MarR family winged helix-turn-helix transcriptional regulator [Pseudomonadota bacterium]
MIGPSGFQPWPSAKVDVVATTDSADAATIVFRKFLTITPPRIRLVSRIHNFVDLSNCFGEPVGMYTQPRSSLRSPSSFVTFRLAKLQASLNAQATGLLKANSGLSLVEWRLIQILRMHKSASLSEIARIVQMDKGQLSRKIKAMVEKGLLRTETDKQDQRVQHLKLTAAAKRLSEKMMPTMEARQALLLADISADDLATFYEVVDKLDKASKQRNIA